MKLLSPRFAANERLNRAANNDPALRAGESGEAVRLVQQSLIDLGFPMPRSLTPAGVPDGIYGSETTAKVEDFQRTNALGVDGVAGRDTLTRLDGLLIASAPLPGTAFDRRVRLHFRSVATPVVPEFTALENAQRVYAQIRIQLQFASGASLGLSDDETLRLDASDGTCEWNQASDELKFLDTLEGRAGLGPDDVLVFYANRIRQNDGTALNGCAGHEPGRPTVVVSATGSPWTLAHELGHVLLGPEFAPVHETDPANLMFSPTSSITAALPGWTAQQAKRVRESPVCAPI